MGPGSRTFKPQWGAATLSVHELGFPSNLLLVKYPAIPVIVDMRLLQSNQ
uniref:Uncharacterized protein n=1 Tax=Anguilla anguilla TaxID=7936 RepID=A0A0E9V271_ANGAN